MSVVLSKHSKTDKAEVNTQLSQPTEMLLKCFFFLFYSLSIDVYSYFSFSTDIKEDTLC